MSSATVLSREPHSAVEAGLIFTAVTALLLGSAVYLLDRDWANTMLLAPFIAYQWPTSAVFGAFGGFLPALLHAYAIPVLIIVALRPWPWTRPWVCLLWFTLASTLEWLQSDAAGALFFAAEQTAGRHAAPAVSGELCRARAVRLHRPVSNRRWLPHCPGCNNFNCAA